MKASTPTTPHHKVIKVLFIDNSRGLKTAIIDSAGAQWFMDLCEKYHDYYGFDHIATVKHDAAKGKLAYELYTNSKQFMPYDLAEAMGLLS